MRPVLLKSAGIVGLAGAIMAAVSSNALFVDPGGPDRPSQYTSGENRSAPGVIVATNSATMEPAGAGDALPLWQSQGAATDALPPAEPVVQPETTASIIPAEPRPLPPPMPETSAESTAASVEPTAASAEMQPAEAPPVVTSPVPRPADVADEAAPSDTQAPAEATDVTTMASAEAPVQVAEIATTSTAPADLTATPAGAPTERDASAAESSSHVSAYWPEDSVDCPRDWIATAATGAISRPPNGCETIASMVAPTGGDLATLRAALSENVLDLVALAPAIPVPGADAPAAEAKPDPAPGADAPAAETKPEPAPAPDPAPVRTSRASDWPAGPPPDCGDKHAYWHFIQGHHGPKEWYCR